MPGVNIKNFRFRFDRSLQAAAYFVHLAGGEIPWLALLKLLYITERKYLETYGEMMTGDQVVAMKHGPVLSNILNLIKGRANRSDEWARYLQTLPQSRMVRLIGNPGTGTLCRASIKVMDDVFAEYGHLDKYRIRDLTHDFPEWQKYHKANTSTPIPWEEILRLNGKAKMIETAINQIELDAYQHALFGVEE